MRIELPVPAQALEAIRVRLEAGAERVEAPLLQPLGLLLDLAGEAMRARLFVVQAEGGAEACLRPDFTVAIAQRHVEGGNAVGRYVYEGPAFRASPGDDRAEEFVQLGLEIFQPAKDEASVEIANLAWRAALAGGRKDLTLWLGDASLFAAFIDSLLLPHALAARLRRVARRPRLLNAELARAGKSSATSRDSQLTAMLAGLSETRAAAMLEEVWTLAGVEPVGRRGTAEIVRRLVRRAEEAEAPALTEAQAGAIGDFMAISERPEEGLKAVRALAGKGLAIQAAVTAWRKRLRELDAQGDQLVFAPALGHAFDYYDGLTFEVRSEALGAERPVAVGGRYDGLLVRLGAKKSVSAVGCMVRPWRAFAGGEA